MAATILIADDDWMNRELMQAHLEHAGFHVLTANNGAKALEVARSELPNLVVLDVRMPLLDGYQVCVHLKSTPATSHIPVFLITALEDEASKRKGAESGADDFVSKPFEINDILARIQRFL